MPSPTQAGLLIAETEFALQVESDIAPYKGLLMGLFFMTVGMEISVGLFFAKIRTVLAGITGLLLGKVGWCTASNPAACVVASWSTSSIRRCHLRRWRS